MFARVLIDMSITNEFPDEVCFENEHGELITQSVIYDRKPLWCKKCEQLGHVEEIYKVISQPLHKVAVEVDGEGFQLVQSKAKLTHHPSTVRPLIPSQSGLADILTNANGFDALESVEEGIEIADEESNKGTGGFPIHDQ